MKDSGKVRINRDQEASYRSDKKGWTAFSACRFRIEVYAYLTLLKHKCNIYTTYPGRKTFPILFSLLPYFIYQVFLEYMLLYFPHGISREAIHLEHELGALVRRQLASAVLNQVLRFKFFHFLF